MSKTASDLPETRSEERAHAEQVMSRLDTWATAMDTRFRIPFTPIRFGLDPIVGLIPGAGDVMGALLSAYIFGAALKNGMPKRKIGRMAANIGVEFVIGMVPILGTLFDVHWRANVKNVDLLREHMLPDMEIREPRKERGLRWRQLGLWLMFLLSAGLLYYLWQVGLLQAWFDLAPGRTAS